MGRALELGTYLAAATLVLSVVLLLAGLVMAARPEMFAGLGLQVTSKSGLALALAAGIGVIATAGVGRLLSSLRTTLDG